MSTRRTRLVPKSRMNNFKSIRGLKCFDEVYERLCKGWPTSEVARFIQEDRKELTHYGVPTLISILTEFRKEIPPADKVKHIVPKDHVEAIEALEKGMDEVEAFQKLYQLQLSRIESLIEKEKQMGSPLPNITGNEIRIAKEILTGYAGLRMDLGLTKRQQVEVKVEQSTTETKVMRIEEHQTQTIEEKVEVSVQLPPPPVPAPEPVVPQLGPKTSTKPEVERVLNNPFARKKVLSIIEKLLTVPQTVADESTTSEPMQVIEAEFEVSDSEDAKGEDTDADSTQGRTVVERTDP